MSKKTRQLLLLALAILLMYLSSTVLSAIPSLICMILALGLTFTCLIRMIQEVRK